MTELNQLPRIKTKSKKRLGRGYGSGKGKYSTRGQKGQKAKTKSKILFEGGQILLSTRLPMLRGKNKNKPVGEKPLILNVGDLEKLSTIKKGAIINGKTLTQVGLIRLEKPTQTIKLLGRGKLTKSLKVEIPASKKAVNKVKQAGGEYRI
jgi:large subunit ribosomal protein L15